jgi:inorganic triphosphatase YgiF
MRNVSGKELELKLTLTPEELQRIDADPALEDLTVGKPVTRTLRSIYFDTPDHRLRAQGISLRLRAVDGQSGSRKNARWLQTIKGGKGVRNGVSNPDEIEAVVAGPEPDLEAIDNRKLRQAISKVMRSSPLEPQFETVVTRTTRQLHSDKGDLELALDQGVVRAGSAEAKLCEAELELKAGSPECLLEAAAALFASQPIRLAETSKAERGYDLLLGRSDPRVVPCKGKPPALEGGETCGDALALFVASATSQVERNARALLETDDPEAAHQLRVGLRRLRSALRAFRSIERSPATLELARYAREIGQKVGELRNADILIDEIYGPVAAARKGEPGFGELRDALLAHRDKVRGEARAGLLSEQWSRLQLYLALWPETVKSNPRLDQLVDEFAPVSLAKIWRKVAKMGDKLERLSIEKRHELRKALKTLRYAAEFFASLYDPRQVNHFIKDLKRLQDVFGYMNDVATANALTGICAERCASSPAAHRAAGYALGWHEKAAEQTWDGVTAMWERLARRDRFWEDGK